MEVFRRLGLADRIRNTGLPPEYRNDVAMCVLVLGTELSRIKLPSRAGRVRGEKGADGHWPCAEWGHRINQLHLEPLLFAHAAAQPCIRILNRTQFEEFIQDSNVVTAIARDLDSGEPVTIRCRYLAGCDGGRSTVRKAIGAELAVKPQKVIPGQTESADRWLACEANMRPVPVVAMEPSGQRGISLL